MAKKQAARPRRKAVSSSELDNECAAILKLLADEEDQHFQIGVHYNRIVDGRLYKDGGFKSAAELVSRRLGGIPASTLALYGAIAKAFSEEAATKYGSARLGELLVYEKATGAKLPSGDPGQVPIKVPDGSSMKEKPFADCSLRELRAAVHKLRVPHQQPRLPEEDKETLDGLEKVLARQFAPPVPIVIHTRRDPKSETSYLTLTLAFEYLEPLRDVLIALFRNADSFLPGHRRAKSATSAAANGKNGRHPPSRNAESHRSRGAPHRGHGVFRQHALKHRHASHAR
jgi:hypothetical protein